MVFRPFPIMSFLAAIALGILLMLGKWQWAKFVQKRDLPPVESLERRELSAWFSTLDGENGDKTDFLPTTVTGQWRPGTVPVYALFDGIRGERWFSPFETEFGTIIVDRGWVAEGTEHVAPPPEQVVKLDGMLRVAGPANPPSRTTR